MQKRKAMRIIAGSLRGKKIKSLPGLATRPLLGRVKKSLFDILGDRVVDASLLDLYAGTGSVGIEALSRGASYVLFVEKDTRLTRLIKENLKKCDLEKKGEIAEIDILSYTKGDRKFSLLEQFDLIFAGPPYKLNLTGDTLDIILKLNLLRKNGWVICQHHFKEKVPEKKGFLSLFRKERYGKTVMSFYKAGNNLVGGK
ncbi:MAG: 16S rRNA (guanine(966)-N(2))-methyltransferase RsmD [Elusimicrobiota bacterium]|nr:16S rRNA (guanine(966)-N(2))-methyltransferase RsmD [Elusimicrobiota bacterium]